MKKMAVMLLLALLMVAAISTGSAAAASNLDVLVMSVVFPRQIQAEGMKLDDFLTQLNQGSDIRLLAVPEAADVKIDYTVTPGQSLDQVMAELTQKYGLRFQLANDYHIILVLKGMSPENVLAAPRSMLAAGAVAAVKERRMAFPLAPPPANMYAPFHTEEYGHVRESGFLSALQTPLSTFSIDVDTASYSLVRRFLNSGQRPEADAVRTEELLNYFRYDYPQPSGSQPFSVTAEVGDCPWQAGHKLARIGLQGKNMAMDELPPGNLVFLIDVSGSMNAPNKLPLIKTAFRMLTAQLRAQDKVSIVVYAGRAGVVLEPTPGNEREAIMAAVDKLEAGGSTAGGEGIELAYKIARENFIPGGNNRVILATDGDFNVGVSSEGELTRLIERRRADGIFLSVLGFGMGNIKDNKMEALADAGNGNYAYIDSALEAGKVLGGQLAGTLYTIARDVKLQVEFNPATVKSYRLIGYENRKLADSDFNRDERDAGDLGAGQSVTALYEIIPAGSADTAGATDELMYQHRQLGANTDWLQVKVRYKPRGEDASVLYTQAVGGDAAVQAPSNDFTFAAAVAEYGLILGRSEYRGQARLQQALELAQSAKGDDAEGYRGEFIRLVAVTRALTGW